MFTLSSPRASRLLAAVALTAAGSLALAACTTDSPDEDSSDGSKTVGFSMPYLTNQFMVSLNEATSGALKDDGWNVLATTDAGSQSDKQVQDVNNLIAAGADALVIDPFDSGAIVAALDAAKKAEIPVVLVDVGTSGGEAYMTVRADNEGAAATVCQEMGARLEERYGEAKGTVLQLQGELSSVAGQERTNGFDSCMEENFPEVDVISQPTNWDGTKAANAAQTIVNSREIDAIYLQSDCGMLAPVQSVLEQAGKSTSVDDPDRIILGAIDGCATTLESIRNGDVDFTVEQPLTDYGQRTAYFLNAALEGTTFEPGEDEFGGEIIQDDSGNLTNLVPATLVTKENVDDTDLWGNAG